MIKFENKGNQNHLYINDVIGDDVNIKSFRDELNKLENNNDLIIHINSCGGSVFEGWAIANAIREESKKRNTICIIEGLAASIATAISIACNEVQMYSNSLFMIHRASTMAWGNVNDLQKQIEVLTSIDNQLAEAYATKSNGKYDKEHFLQLMDNESWLSSDEALEMGLIDSIVDQEISYVACAEVSKLNFKNTSKLENLINKVKEKELEKITSELLYLYKWLDNFDI